MAFAATGYGGHSGNFAFKFDKEFVDGITEITIPAFEVDEIVHKSSGMDGKVRFRKSAGLYKLGDLTVKMQLTEAVKKIVDHFEKVKEGKHRDEQIGITVMLKDFDLSAPVITHNFANCFVKKIDHGSFKPGSTDAHVVTVTFCYDEHKVEVA